MSYNVVILLTPTQKYGIFDRLNNVKYFHYLHNMDFCNNCTLYKGE